jgi:hypothetical protein
MSNRKLVSFRLPDDLMQDLRTTADHDSISVTELVCRLLRQGLKSHADRSTEDSDDRVEMLVDKRIASLEEELQDLKQFRQAAQSVPTPPSHKLMATQSWMSHESRLTQLERMKESNGEMNTRLTEIEQMVKTLVAHIQD